MNTTFLSEIKKQLPSDVILSDPAECIAYSYDNSRYRATPDLVIQANNQAQIEILVKLCREFQIPLTARGSGTGTTGAAVPIEGGVVLSLEKMNRIVKIDVANRVLVAEAGATNQAVQDAAKKHGFFWPPDPTSSAYCTVGGNIACNAGGPRTVKYGATRDNVLGLSAVIGTGDTIKTGVYTTKSSVAYDLTRLLIGSEGTLAIVTEAILKLIPLPESIATLQIFYSDLQSATEAISAIMAQAIIPCALEFIDGKALKMIASYAQEIFPENAAAMLIVEVDGATNLLSDAQEKIAQAATNSGLLLLNAPENEIERQKIWRIRKALSPALRTVAPKKINEDVVVPVSQIPNFIAQVEKFAQEYRINIINFGHAGNGNIHVNLLIDPNDELQQKNADACLEKIFDLVLQLNGSISGEHGIGLDKRMFLAKEFNPATLDLMQKIKQQFDPAQILNPGKIFLS